MDMEPWDMAAGILLIKEAGGAVYDPKGQSDFWGHRALVAGNERIARQLQALV
jgi:myo-inositol-1(or 4)-monophosphatase